VVPEGGLEPPTPRL